MREIHIGDEVYTLEDGNFSMLNEYKFSQTPAIAVVGSKRPRVGAYIWSPQGRSKITAVIYEEGYWWVAFKKA